MTQKQGLPDASAAEQQRQSPRDVIATALGAVLALSTVLPSPATAQQTGKWAASWSTAIQSAYVAPTTPQGAAISAYDPQPDLSFALPNATSNGATNQTFRMIIKPDLWSDTVRVRFSNVFGTQSVVFSDAAVALQDYQANLVPNSSAELTFGGQPGVTIPAGQQVFSDPVQLPFMTSNKLPDDLRGRNLAVSFAVQGSTGPASYHDTAFTTSYISPPNSGDVVADKDASSYPYSTTSFFFVSELDALVQNDTIVVCAFGDSITDGTFSTLNGNDRWSNELSRKLHDKLGGKVSVVNEGIGGNAVAATVAGQPATERVRSRLVWMEGINDLGSAMTTPVPIIAGYQQVVSTLHGAGVAVIGATLTPSLVPGGQVPSNSPLAANVSPAIAASYGSAQTDAYRKQLNTFILTSGIFDATVDFAAVTTDPSTGTLLAPFVPNSEGSAGDYLHPNRAGYQAMGDAAATAVLGLIGTSASR